MTKEEILQRISEVFVDTFELDPDQIRPTAHLIDELDLDSIDLIDLVVRLESQTGLDVLEEDLRGIRIVQDVVDLVYTKLGSELSEAR